jgi:hypothetical protein
MTDRRTIEMDFGGLSICGVANSAMGNLLVGTWGWSITNFVQTHSLSATESSAANIAKALATLIQDLVHRGIIQGTGTSL